MLFISDKLDAINILLAAVGESPVNTLNNTQSVDVDNAIRMLDGVSRTIQSKGWTFNTSSEQTIIPDSTNHKIRYNPTWISYLSTDGNTYVKRGDYLYNLTGNTFNFEKNITLTIIEAVDFDDLPDVFKTYITANAASKFQAKYFGDDNVENELLSEAAEAYAEIVQYSIDTSSNMYQITGMAGLLERS